MKLKRVLADRAEAVEAIRSGESHAVCMGCHVLIHLGFAAGDVVSLVWGYLEHPNGMVRGNAGAVLLKCCPDRRVLAEAARLLEADSGEDNMGGAFIRYVTYRLRKAAEAEGGAAPADGGTSQLPMPPDR